MGESAMRTQMTKKVPQKQPLTRYDWAGWSELWGFKQNKTFGCAVEIWTTKDIKNRYLCDNIALVSISDPEWHYPKAVAD